MKNLFFLLIAILSFTSCVQSYDWTRYDAEIVQFNVESTTLYIGESYSASAVMELIAPEEWNANMAIYLSDTKEMSIDTSAIGEHIYSGWWTPAGRWSYVSATNGCAAPNGVASHGTSNLYINPMFWSEEPAAHQRPFGTYYLIAVADQNRSLSENDEMINNFSYIEVEVRGKNDLYADASEDY